LDGERQAEVEQLVPPRLFISRYIVQMHVKHVFLKLGIASRVALAHEVTRQAERRPDR